MRKIRKTSRRIASVVQYVTYVCVALGFLYPHPYGLVIPLLAAIPFVAVALAVMDRDAYTLEGRGDDERGHLTPAVILPGFALLYRAAADQEILDWRPMLWFAGIVSIGWAALLDWAAPELRGRKWSFLSMAVVMGAYGYGASALVDFRLDRSEPTVFATTVLGKHSTSGRSRTHYLDVAPWGPRTGHDDVEVTRDFYDRTREGDTVCVYLWPGALGARWFETRDCPRG
jgi:hypothetical protein